MVLSRDSQATCNRFCASFAAFNPSARHSVEPNAIYSQVIQSFHEPVRSLNIKTLHVYLIEPLPTFDQTMEAWRALEDLFEEGSVDGIGLSGFALPEMEDVMRRSRRGVQFVRNA